MRYIPRKSLWRALLVGFILLSISYTYSITGRHLDNISLAQAASSLAPEIFLQEPEGDYVIYLPSTTQPPRVELSEVWTADEYRTPKEAFLPGKVIRYYAKGYVNIIDSGIVSLRWSVNGPCGSKVMFDGTGQINQGQWTLFQTDTAINCPGVYTYTLRMAYQDKVTTENISYVVNNSSEVVSMSLQGFDKCNIPYGSKTESINQMQTWWNLSPYYSINLYMGGISRYCTNSELDAVWVNQVAKQGWSFIPTWVGPQAPCSNYKYRISSSPTTAYQQGLGEANAAVDKARNLGFLGNTVIYYDMEMYSTTNLACRDAVNSFLAGWSQRLQEHGVRSGVYGHRVNVNDWATIAYPGTPHNVWIASWIRSRYDPYVTAYGIPGISDSLWHDQRIRQYAGDHVDTYGGIGFSIDSNIMDGEVTVLPNPTISATGMTDSKSVVEAGVQIVNISSAPNPQIEAMQLVSADTGWAIVDQMLFWTKDGGSEWSDITPPAAASGSLMAAQFIDHLSGWAISQDPVTGEMTVWFTTNSGQDWESLTLIEGNAVIGPLASAVYLDVLDDQTGWVVVRLVSSANFNTGRLFRITNGGENLEEFGIPFGAPVSFIDMERGWLAGGPAGNQLFYTQDGGRAWQEQNLKSSIPQEIIGGRIGLPEFHDLQNASLPITHYQFGTSKKGYLTTNDGGATWQYSSQAFMDKEGLSVSSIPTFEQANLPEGTVKSERLEDGQVWVQIERTDCRGIKIPPGTDSLGSGSFHCEKLSYLLSTFDGGATWVDITPYH